MLALVLAIALVAVASPVGDGAPGDHGTGPRSIQEDQDRFDLTPRHEWRKSRKRASECRLGGRRFSLDETWSPDLGPPFGIWNCVRCQCVKVRKKNRIVAKVQCRNVKTECPKVTCNNPVILEGQCCKTCPQETQPQESIQDNEIMVGMAASPPEPEPEEEQIGRHFAVLINGRTSLSPMTSPRVATGRLFLRRKNLHFSFLLEEGVPPPASIQFLNDTGYILEELEAQPTPYEATNTNICGTWTQMPREYRALLREERMRVALIPQNESVEDTISGQVARYTGTDTEVFSALLVPSPDASQALGGGGTAMISVSAKTDSLHVSLVFNGVFSKGEAHNATLKVELVPERALSSVTDTVIITKVSSDLNRAELMTTLGESSLRLLTRGLVKMRVWSESAPELALEGMITPRATCNVFATVLSPTPAAIEAVSDTSSSVNTPSNYGAGWAVLTLSNEGAFQYQIYVKGTQVDQLKLETTHRRGLRVVEDLSNKYSQNWSNGTYNRPSYRDLDALLSGKMEVVVKGMNPGEELRGTLNPVPLTEALRSPTPVLLSSPEIPLAATAWVAVDSDCVMHYDVMVSGKPPNGEEDPKWALTLREEDKAWDPRYDMKIVILEQSVKGNDIFSHTTQLTLISLARLEAGATYLELALLEPDNSQTSLKLIGRIEGVSVPSTCRADIPKIPNETSPPRGICIGPECTRLRDDTAEQAPTYKCIDDALNVFEDGSSWSSPENACQRCMCKRGKIQCQDVLCPPAECPNPVTVPGECCPTCHNSVPSTSINKSTQVCLFNSQSHNLGTLWHPFLPPNGFDKCTTCTCKMGESNDPQVKCWRETCPPLDCDLSERIPPAEDKCCSTCPPKRIANPNFQNHSPESEEEARRRILESGGCERMKVLYNNGDEYHPRIKAFGTQPCITCKCQNGKIGCERTKCPVLTCPIKIQRGCCEQCIGTRLKPMYTWLQPSRRKKPKQIHKSDKRNYKKPYKKKSSG